MKGWIPSNQSFSTKFHKYLQEYGKLSTIHTVYYITEQRSKFEKFFWITILCLSLSGCFFMITKLWKKYEENPIIVSFAPKESSLNEIPFPAVTICPEAKCSMPKFNYSNVYFKIINDEKISDQERKTFSYMELLCENHYDSINFTFSDRCLIKDDFFDVIDKVRPELTIHNCVFLGSRFNCEDYLLQLVTDQGVCLSFNLLDLEEIFRKNVLRTNKTSNFKSKNYDIEAGYLNNADHESYPVRVTMAGADNALQILLSLNYSEIDVECNPFMQGFRVAIHRPEDIPQLSKHYFKIPHDSDVMIAVQPNLVTTTKEAKNYDAKKRGCYMKNERPLKYFKMYTQSNCLLECYTNFTLKMCGCVHFFMPRENNGKICGTSNTICLEKSETNIKYGDFPRHKLGLNQTSCDCKPSCTVVRYDIETSQNEFWLQSFDKNDREDVNYNDDIRYSRLNVYFKSDNFMKLERKEMYGISDFISNFGGLLGLFIGFSLISLIEIIYFLTLRIFCNRRLYRNWAGSKN